MFGGKSLATLGLQSVLQPKPEVFRASLLDKHPPPPDCKSAIVGSTPTGASASETPAMCRQQRPLCANDR